MNIDASTLGFEELNRQIAACKEDVTISHCVGHRFIGAGQSGRVIRISGTPGNALGAYLNGAEIWVDGNAQDATGDTMNDGRIVVYGSCGDAAGYAMRGGKMFIRDSVGYRAGIHMKEYADKKPVMVIGGRCGSFLGEYQAGGVIVVLGLGHADDDILGNFCGTGMHGGRIFIRADRLAASFPAQVCVRRAEAEDLAGIRDDVGEFCRLFAISEEEVYRKPFFLLTPNTSNPYRQMYVQN